LKWRQKQQKQQQQQKQHKMLHKHLLPFVPPVNNLLHETEQTKQEMVV
jgi:hypothetical protein